MTIDLDELKRLEKAATRGPWVQWVGHGDIVAFEPDTNTASTLSGDGPAVATTDIDDVILDDEDECDKERLKSVDNAALIVAARNALPELIAEVERLRELMMGLMTQLAARNGGRIDLDEP